MYLRSSIDRSATASPGRRAARAPPGPDDDDTRALLDRLYSPFMLREFKVIHMDVKSAELTKYAANGMLALRQQLADELKRLTNSDRFDFLADHRGMFSRLGTTPEMVEKLRADHGIYMVGDSRMNIAGLNEKTVPILAKAIVEAGV